MIALNVLANLMGMAVSIAVQAGIAFGGYRLAGAEQYGLIGFFAVLLTAAAIFDAGLGQTVTRVVARNQVENPSTTGSLVFNFMTIYGALAAAIALVVWVLSPIISTHWLRPQHITQAEVQLAVTLMGVGVAIQRLRGIFQATLEGLERQVLCNVLLASTGILRLVLGLGALAFVAPTAEAFFWSQIIASICETSAFAVAVHRVVPSSFTPRGLEIGLIWQTMRFAMANMASAATGTMVQIADSIVISAALPLSVFGTYSLVATMCSAMVRLTTPLITAVFPRMSAYVSAERAMELRNLFFTASQATFVLMLTAAGALVFFGDAFLELVTGHAEAGRDFAPVLAALAVAYALGGLCRPSHALQMAEGDPLTALKVNIICGVFYLPAIILLTPQYGVILPALCLVAANFLAFVLFTSTAFRMRLRGLALRWMTVSVLPQIIAVVVCYGFARFSLDPSAPLMTRLAAAVATSLFALSMGTLVSDHMRPHILSRGKRLLRRSA